MKPRIEHRPRTPKLPPILEIDEDGVPVAEFEMFERPRWNADGDDDIGVQMGDWPTDLDD